MRPENIEELLKKITGFDWDKGNVNKNWKRHKVGVKECEETFLNEQLVFFEDDKHSINEKRYGVFGRTNRNRRLTIFFAIRRNKIRIISARDQSRKERNQYEKQS